MKKETISWQAHEFEHRDKTPDWFWALGIIGVSVTVASVIKGNYVFALFVIIATAALGFYGAKRPDILDITLSQKGVTVKKFFHDYRAFDGFWVDGEERKIHLSTRSTVMPMMTIPLGDEDPDEVREFLMQHLEEKELHESTAHRIMEMLGF